MRSVRRHLPAAVMACVLLVPVPLALAADDEPEVGLVETRRAPMPPVGAPAGAAQEQEDVIEFPPPTPEPTEEPTEAEPEPPVIEFPPPATTRERKAPEVESEEPTQAAPTPPPASATPRPSAPSSATPRRRPAPAVQPARAGAPESEEPPAPRPSDAVPEVVRPAEAAQDAPPERRTERPRKRAKERPESTFHLVAPGESLWLIARGALPADASNAQIAPYVSRIWDANAEAIGTGDPDLIMPGQCLRMPSHRLPELEDV